MPLPADGQSAAIRRDGSHAAQTAVPTAAPGPRGTVQKPWLTYAQASPPGRLRLFCLPCAGGGPAVFRAWRDILGTDVEVHPILTPGRDSRLLERPYDDLDALTQALAPALATDMPYALLGHSTGALIAYGLARRLRELAAPPAVRLFVVAYRAPHLPSHDGTVVKHRLDDDGFLAALRDFDGTPGELLSSPDLLQLFLPAIRADIAISETYEHSPAAPLDVPISAFGGVDDPLASEDHLQAWEHHTSRGLSLRMLPGGHFLLNDRNPLLLDAVRADLEQDLACLR